MMIRKMLFASTGAAALFAASQAQAATINLIDLGGVTGSQAEQGFKIAAAYWSNVLTNNATINLGVRFAGLGTGIIGSTGSARQDFTVANWETRVNNTKSGSALDQSVVLPTLTGGGITNITHGVDADDEIDTSISVLNEGTNTASQVLYLNTSVVKAIGGTAVYQPGSGNRDGNVTFSSNFSFDFDPTDGITAGRMDFIGVAIHEIGHALGFVSGVDFFDYYGSPDGPGHGEVGYNLNDTSIFSALDMFRYSNDPDGLAPGSGAVLDHTVGGDKYFSIDGGATALFGNNFASGRYNGDGDQASHWRDANGCSGQLGIMDPTFCYGQMGEITALDLAAYDAMGWNINFDVLGNPSYLITSADIYNQYAAAVPEPATWAMMISGFGFVGASLRSRRRQTKVSFA